MITINGNKITARKLIAPSRRLILSNVHTCIPNSIILDALRYAKIKTTSAIHELHIGTNTTTIPLNELEKYKHIASFRRAVYIEDNDELLPESLLINYENESYRIFVNENEKTCHLCKESSHVSSLCPKYRETNKNPQTSRGETPEQITFQEKIAEARMIRDSNQLHLDTPVPEQPLPDISTTTDVEVALPAENCKTTTESAQADEAIEEMDTESSLKRTRRSNSTFSSESASNTQVKQTKKSKNSETLHSNNPSNVDPQNFRFTIKQLLEESPDLFPTNTTADDIIELLYDLLKYKTGKVLQTMANYTRKPEELMPLLTALRDRTNHRGLKNRITRITNHAVSKTQSSLSSEEDTELEPKAQKQKHSNNKPTSLQ